MNTDHGSASQTLSAGVRLRLRRGLPYRVRKNASKSWCTCGKKATNFRGIKGDCRLAVPIEIIRGISAGKLDDSFQTLVTNADLQ